MRYTLTILFLCLFSLSIHAQVLATAGNKKITLNYFNDRYSKIKRQVINAPKPEVFLEDLIRYEIGLQEARKRKLENDPRVRQKMNEELYKGLIETSIGSTVQDIKVTEEEMKAYYKNNPEVKTSHILIEFPPGASEKQIAAARKRAREIYAKVKKSKRPFEELVKLYSDDTLSRAIAGDIGYQSRVTLVPTYYETALKMKTGQIRGLVRTRYGFHIIKLTGIRSYAEANKQQVRAAVFDTKRKEVFDQFFVRLKKNYKINVNRLALKKIK